ncbi:MAG: DedA family protein [Patescibacteria group bacterium]
MPLLPGILAYAVTVPYLATYGFVLIAAIIEGPIMFFLCGFLVRLGVLSLIPAFISLMAGDLIGDTLWYLVGYRYGRRFIHRFGKYVSITEEKIEQATVIFKTHHDRILVISKITNGFGFAIPVLVTAGLTKLPFRKFFIFNFAGEIVRALLLVGGGYFFGAWYSQIDTWVGRVGLGFALILTVVVFIQFGRYLSKKAQVQIAA